MADQAINALSTKTAPETSDQLLLVDTGELQLIDYDKLADAILNKITSKNYALDAGTMTLPAALNALNGKTFKGNISLISYNNNDESYITAVFSVSPDPSCNPCVINIANRVCVFFLNGYIPKLLGFSMTSNVIECFFSGTGVTNITLTIKFGKDNYLSKEQCKTATIITYMK